MKLIGASARYDDILFHRDSCGVMLSCGALLAARDITFEPSLVDR